MKNKFYYANYDKNGNLIGVYDSLREAVKRAWGVSTTEKKYKGCVGSICTSIRTGRSIKGRWYKFTKDE